MNKKGYRITISVLVIAGMLSSGLSAFAVDDYAQKSSVSNSAEENFEQYSYQEYLSEHQLPAAKETVEIDLSAFSADDKHAELVSNYKDYRGNTIVTNDHGSIHFDFVINQTGSYNIELEYLNAAGKGVAIVRKILIDGKLPFDEARNIALTRLYQDETREYKTDEKGNQIRPSQKETEQWQTVRVRDSVGLYQEPLLFALETGKHTLTLEAVKEPVAIRAIRLLPAQTPPAYADKQSEYRKKGYQQAEAAPIYIQGEKAVLKSDSMLYPTVDRSSPATVPSSPSHIVLNTIGGDKWKLNGQWLEWEFMVEKAGLYQITAKYRQNVINGAISYRTLTIDGDLPFAEAANLAFPYDTGWHNQTFGEENGGWQFYLEPGRHTIRLQAVLGNMSSLIARVDCVVQNLSEVHKKMLMVLGPDPDPNRDVDFKAIFHDELEMLRQQTLALKEIKKEYISLTGLSGEQAQILESVIDQTEEMYEKPHKIVKLFDAFVNNISALGNWSSIAKQQPLELDYLCVHPSGAEIKKADAVFFDKISYAFRSFFYTFTNDYNSIGAEDADVTIWVGNGATGGRDQANVLDQLIKNYFTSKTDIRIRLQLVQMGSLISASVAGKGPDVALTLSSVDAMNYALRGAVQDLSDMDGFDEVQKRYHKSAMVPLTFQGKVYGIPETQTFPMMFYRKDILQEIGIEVPQTWRDVIVALPKLQKKRLNFGLPIPISSDYIGAGMTTYAMLLFQKGGTLYNEDFTASALDTEKAVDTFVEWTDFYTDYTLPLQYDAINRFRMGEIPIMIADYSTYNNLSVFAPELEGLWGFANVPGTEREDGTIDHSVAGSVTASVIMKSCKNKDAAWKFIKWWSEAETQTMFAYEIESIMGSAGRYAPANQEALYQIPWGAEDFEKLLSQWNWVKGVPEIPGSYMTNRYVDFAFKQVVIGQTIDAGAKYNDPGEVLIKATKTINSEIKSKYKEFGF